MKVEQQKASLAFSDDDSLQDAIPNAIPVQDATTLQDDHPLALASPLREPDAESEPGCDFDVQAEMVSQTQKISTSPKNT